MCRLFAVTSETPISPMVAINALDIMQEGHDGSGVGLFLRDLGGPFEEIKDAPILSGIFTESGLKRLDMYMMELGFMTKYKISIKVPKTAPPGFTQSYLEQKLVAGKGLTLINQRRIAHDQPNPGAVQLAPAVFGQPGHTRFMHQRKQSVIAEMSAIVQVGGAHRQFVFCCGATTSRPSGWLR